MPGTGTDPRRASRVQSVDRAVQLLRAIGAGSVPETSTAQLAETCGLNRATAWRILSTLEAQGMVSQDRTTGQWSVGAGIVELARSAGVDMIAASAHGVLARLSLQTGETAALAVVRDQTLVYVDEVGPPSVVAATWLGRAVPLHATSTGKALLAFADPATRSLVLSRPLVGYTDTTVTDPTELLAELALTRDRGYGTCRGEFEATAYGVSAPVLHASGRLLAVLSVWGPLGRVTESRFDALGGLVRDAAALLGASGRTPA